ncbi:MAG: threonine synthase [Candidatus Omnitrophica bacterium]|jgi:threonine synthase|nr:threonine synthase [Candidatus Omnitrophota bacterium]
MKKEILFYSTNKSCPPVPFSVALLQGQAPDYGLYMPEKIKKISGEEILSFKNKSYQQIAFEVIKNFIPDVIPDDKLFSMIKEAYNFTIPIEHITENFYIIRLDRGPTASFKDFAARLMARFMEYFTSMNDKHLIVLVATSGDTGSAIANAFLHMKNIDVVILFPKDEVTEKQRKQMTTLDYNIHPIAIKGKFDDCQAIIKKAFNDQNFKNLNLTSANSINIGRLIPQSVYYFYAYSRIDSKKINFSVPSGNFGNLMGGVLAKKTGLPVNKFIVAVNKNDEFPGFLKTGRYSPVVPSKKCSSNAMNVGHPSNLARLMDLYGGWFLDVRDEYGNVIKKGVFKKYPDIKKMRKDFISFSINDTEVDNVIKKYYEQYNIIIEPHGAVAVASAEKSNIKEQPIICLETADPAKFSEKIEEILHIKPEFPKSMEKLDTKKEKFEIIPNRYEKFKEFIKSIFT